MRIRLSGVTIGDDAAKRAHEVHEVLVTALYTTHIDGDTLIAAAPGNGFGEAGWSASIEAAPGNVLRIRCDPGATPLVRFFARVEWSEVGNLNHP